MGVDPAHGPDRHSVLLVEDSPGTCELVATALIDAGPGNVLYVEQNVESAWHFLNRRRETLPTLVLLDLSLRNASGFELLRRLKADPGLCRLPVVVFTSSDDQLDIARAYAHGANGYVVKPSLFEELVELLRDICRYWLVQNRIAVSSQEVR
jgi:chemotaxis family two-component system response regulator Rcp1